MKIGILDLSGHGPEFWSTPVDELAAREVVRNVWHPHLVFDQGAKTGHCEHCGITEKLAKFWACNAFVHDSEGFILRHCHCSRETK